MDKSDPLYKEVHERLKAVQRGMRSNDLVRFMNRHSYVGRGVNWGGSIKGDMLNELEHTVWANYGKYMRKTPYVEGPSTVTTRLDKMCVELTAFREKVENDRDRRKQREADSTARLKGERAAQQTRVDEVQESVVTLITGLGAEHLLGTLSVTNSYIGMGHEDFLALLALIPRSGD